MLRTIPYVKIPRSPAAGFFTRVAIAITVLFLVVEGFWLIVLPGGMIRGFLEGSLDNDYVYLRSEGFKKGIFYNFSVAKLSLMKRSSGGAADALLLEFDDLKGKVDLLSVVAFRPEVVFRCRMNDSDITGRVALTGRGKTAVSGDNIRMKQVPFLEAIGIHAEGVMSGDFSAEKNTGSLKVSLADASFRNSSLAGVFLPLEVFHDVKGSAAISSGTVEVRSLAMTGNGVYGRVKGSAKGGYMDMNFELMTEPSFRLDPFLQAMIERYKVSPGYYVFPLKGEIPHGQ